MKRSLKFQSSMNFQIINPKHLFNALKWLKQNNSYYANVNVRNLEQWLKQSEENDKENVLENLLCDDPSVEKEYEELADIEVEPDAEQDDARDDMQGKRQSIMNILTQKHSEKKFSICRSVRNVLTKIRRP